MFFRTPLLFEGVKKRMRQWNAAHDDLSRVTSRGWRARTQLTNRWDRRRQNETPEQHARRLATPTGIDDHFHDQVASRPRYRAKLDSAKALMDKRDKQLRQAEEKREAKRRRKQMMQAPVPSLEPVQTRTPAAVVQTAQKIVQSRPMKKLAPRRRRSN